MPGARFAPADYGIVSADARRRFAGRKRLRFLLGALLAALVHSAPAIAQSAESPSEDHRLVGSFVQDGAVVRGGWLEAQAGYASWDGGRDARLNALVAFRVASKGELGARFGYLDRSRSEDDVIYGERLSSDFSNNGFADMDLFGKVQIRSGERAMSVGLLAKLPTASENERLGSGSTDFELFFADRRTRNRFAWIWNAGARFNGDAKTPGGGSGQTSGFAAGGMIWRISYSWIFLAETRYESRRYDGDDPDFRLSPSLDIRPTENLALRFSFGVGLASGSPNQEYGFGLVFRY